MANFVLLKWKNGGPGFRLAWAITQSSARHKKPFVRAQILIKGSWGPAKNYPLVSHPILHEFGKVMPTNAQIKAARQGFEKGGK